MQLSSLLGHLVELYRDALAPARPPDAAIQYFFSQRHYLGRRDRTWLSDHAWCLLRGHLRWQALAEIAGDETPAWPAHLLHPQLAALAPDTLLHATLLDTLGPDFADELPAIFSAVALRLESPGAKPIAGHPALPTVLPAAAWWHDWACQRVPELIQRASPLATVRSGWPEWLSPLFSARLRQLGLVTEATSPLELPSPATHFAAFMQPAPLGLRVNLLRGGRAEVLAQLQQEKLEARAGRLSPLALLLSRRPRLQQWPLWRDGHLEVHDEGSQLIAPALVYALTPGGADAPIRVLDACAGGGGKTLHLAAELPSGAQLYASDKSAQRLAPLAERARRAGVNAIRMLPLEEACALRDLDAVLIDAPCTGLGTLRRHPELLWRVTECDVAMRTAQQGAILRAHAAGPRVGGLLVYATCSFLAAENDDIIAAFLDEYPNYRSESPLPAWQAWHTAHSSVAPASLAQGATQYGHQLLPCLHGCDGFFVSVLRKISA